MRTKIKTIHEEEYSDKSQSIGILLNYSLVDDWKESFIYIYRKGVYIFFNTIIDMIDFQFYGYEKIKRAYMTEEEFDIFYDAEFIENSFNEKLKWN